MVIERKIVKKYKTYTSSIKKKIENEYLQLWHQGISQEIIMKTLCDRNYLSKSRILQLVNSRKLTKGLKRNNVKINIENE